MVMWNGTLTTTKANRELVDPIDVDKDEIVSPRHPRVEANAAR